MKRRIKGFTSLVLAVLTVLYLAMTAVAQQTENEIGTTAMQETATQEVTTAQETVTQEAATQEPATAKPVEIVYDERLMGDADNDGRVTASDARFLLRVSVGFVEENVALISRGDLDRDGKISSDDARTALRVAVGLDSVRCIFHGHEITETVVKPSCTMQGYSEKGCKHCAYTEGAIYAVTPATGHALKETTTAASCTQDGIFTSICTVCSFVKEKRQWQPPRDISGEYGRNRAKAKSGHVKAVGHLRPQGM